MLLTIIMDLPSGANQSITKDTYTRNLKLTRAYQDIKGAHADLGEEQQTRPIASCSSKAEPYECLEWARRESDASLVKKEPSFNTLLAESDINIK